MLTTSNLLYNLITASVCTTEHMLNAYLRACKKNSIKPLASLMNQLKV